MWHIASKVTQDAVKAWLDEHNDSRTIYPVHGGSTVTVCALVALAMLGYRKIEVFGLDSCFRKDAHHAYLQSENDADTPQEVLVGDKTFLAAPWMAVQADDIVRVIKYVFSKLEGFEMLIHGDGLVAAMLENAAKPKGD